MLRWLGILALCVACGSVSRPPALTADQGNVEFATISPGDTSPELSVRISNSGGLPTAAVITALAGQDPDAFLVTADGCAGMVLAPAAGCDVHLAFRPSEQREFAAELRISAGAATATVAVAGKAEDASRLSLSSSGHSFAGVELGRSVTSFVTVSNPGSHATEALSFDAAGDTGSFLVAGDCMGRPLAAGSSCDLQITFSPQTLGAKAFSLVVRGSPYTTARVAFDGYGKRLVSLTITTEGDGKVAVAGSADSCVAQPCRVTFEVAGPAPKAILTATPGATSVFSQWVGGCPGSATSCELAIDGDRSVLAKFSPAVTVTFEATSFAAGSGIIGIEPGTSCAAPCLATARVPRGARVRLSASADTNSQFRWANGCSGTQSACEMTVSADTSPAAVFNGANYVFVTSWTYRTDLGLKAYDQACNDHAQRAGLPGPYLAWLSTSTVDAVSRFAAARGFIRVDGRPFADLLAGNSAVYFPPALDELGAQSVPFPGAVLSGSDQLGRWSPGNNCNDWTDAGAHPLWLGNALSGSGTWSEWGSSSCGSSWPILCMGTALRRPLQPKKSPGRLAFVSSAVIASGGGLAAADSLCAREARTAGLPGSYKALLAVDGASAASRFDLGGPPWVRLDGIPVVEKAADLAAGKLLAPIELTADSVRQFWWYQTWSGASKTGQPGTNTCASWTSTAADSFTYVGSANSIEPEYWFGSYGIPCQPAYQLHLICLQE
ncbi:MAG TPA: choice-of-anchor D domain-containing protein [Myxococcales bacterium]|nr:choice-of-anchor D domain-containing protein [Myxococcales bacterium]